MNSNWKESVMPWTSEDKYLILAEMIFRVPNSKLFELSKTIYIWKRIGIDIRNNQNAMIDFVIPKYKVINRIINFETNKDYTLQGSILHNYLYEAIAKNIKKLTPQELTVLRKLADKLYFEYAKADSYISELAVYYYLRLFGKKKILNHDSNAID